MTDTGGGQSSSRRQRTPIEYQPPSGQQPSQTVPRRAWPEGRMTIKMPAQQLPPGQHRFKQGGSGANGSTSARLPEPDGPEPGEVMGSTRRNTFGGGGGGGLAAAYRAQEFGHPPAAAKLSAVPLQHGRSSMTWSREQALKQQQRQLPVQPPPPQQLHLHQVPLLRPQQRQVPYPAEDSSELIFVSGFPDGPQRRPVHQAAALPPEYPAQVPTPAQPALTRPQQTKFGGGWETADNALAALRAGNSKLALLHARIVSAMSDGAREFAEKGFRKRWAEPDVVWQRAHDPATAAELDTLLAAALGLEDEPLPHARGGSGSPYGGDGGSPVGSYRPDATFSVAARSYSGEAGGSGRVVEMPQHGSGDGKRKRTVYGAVSPTKLSKQRQWQDKQAAADGLRPHHQQQQQQQQQHNGAASKHSNKTTPSKPAPKMAPRQAAPSTRPAPKPAAPSLDQKLNMSLDALAGAPSSKQQQKKPQQAGHQANAKAGGGGIQPSGKHTPIVFKT